MATSRPPVGKSGESPAGAGGSRVLEYLGSGRNLAGCAGGVSGLVLHFTGLAGSWWPGVVVALYGAGALLWPGKGPGSGSSDRAVGAGSAAPVGQRAPGGHALPASVDRLAASLVGVELPGSSGVAELVERLRRGPESAEAERVAEWGLPVAVDGYLRARTWQPWVPGAADPAVELGREVERLAATLRG
ncbi:hypothetical protein ACWGB8_09855 [Kitasatospora sp. NPDC054939]